MIETYSTTNSEYLKSNESWHVEDSPWKAKQIFNLIYRNNIKPKRIVEVGCGAGEILNQLSNLMQHEAIYHGYDISPDAFELTKKRVKRGLEFYNEDLLNTNQYYDLCLIIDVFEHVQDYIGFIKKCKEKALYKIYHIPLDIHVSAILRNELAVARAKVGHLHYFTKETALSTLVDSGQEIIDYFYTKGSIELPNQTFRTKVVNIFRRLLFKINPDFSSNLLGGYSLIVLTK